MPQSKILKPGALLLPRHMRVRERHAPKARMSAGVEGWLEWRMIDRAGREVRGGEQRNLILDSGLDQIASYDFTAIVNYLAVGTDNTAPVVGDTALGAQVARKNGQFTATAQTYVSPGVYQISATWEWDFGEANGNLTEWGVSPTSAGDLFCRNLFKDTGGTPVPVTKDSSHKLRMTYVLQVTLSPVSSTAGSLTITDYPSVGTDLVVDGHYMLIRSDNAGNVKDRDIRCFELFAQGIAPWNATTSNLARGASLAAVGEDKSASLIYAAGDLDKNLVYRDAADGVASYGYPAAGPGDTPAAYTPGSFQRGTWQTTFVNTAATALTIYGFVLNGGFYTNNVNIVATRPGYLFDFDTATITKDDLHTLSVGMPVVSWARV